MMILVNKIKFGSIISLLSVFLLVSCGQTSPELHQMTIHGKTMGTTYLVKITLEKEVEQNFKNEVKSEIEKLLKGLNLQMSTFIKDSEISKFNRFEESEWFPVSKDTAEVIAAAQKISRESNGCFDITISPLIDLWGFGKKLTEQKELSDEEIEEALTITGYDNLNVQKSPPALRKKLSKISCNLSAIAKGFGVDKLADLLEKKGFENYLVEIGGEDRTSGINFKGKCWRIGILVPDTFDQIFQAVSLKNSSIATSGDYRNYFEIDGKRYSHTINPKTGKPIIHNLASVSVIHPSCMLADAYATAINVMGPEKGFEFAINNNLAVLFIIREKGSFVKKTTDQFTVYLNKENG